jgi:hypothetical protein
MNPLGNLLIKPELWVVSRGHGELAQRARRLRRLRQHHGRVIRKGKEVVTQSLSDEPFSHRLERMRVTSAVAAVVSNSGRKFCELPCHLVTSEECLDNSSANVHRLWSCCCCITVNSVISRVVVVVEDPRCQRLSLVEVDAEKPQRRVYRTPLGHVSLAGVSLLDRVVKSSVTLAECDVGVQWCRM